MKKSSDIEKELLSKKTPDGFASLYVLAIGSSFSSPVPRVSLVIGEAFTANPPGDGTSTNRKHIISVFAEKSDIGYRLSQRSL